MTGDAGRGVSPRVVLQRISRAIPEACRKHFVIIGSLAAGYHLLGGDEKATLRTKDGDCLLSPRVQSVRVAKEVVERLFASGWTMKEGTRWSKPGDAATPDDELPAVRLNPPGETEWFIELLAPPEGDGKEKEAPPRVETSRGHFGLPTYRFLVLADLDPVPTEFGISIARVEMLALANLLEHPRITRANMSALIGGRSIRRCNKDLGRVLAIARLGGDSMVETWPALWERALKERFPGRWQELALQAGSGMRELLAEDHEEDFEEARHTCEWGLLSSRPPDAAQFRATGLRLILDAIEPMESSARAQDARPDTPPLK